MTKIAIFASGSGTNAENIIKSFSGQVDITAVYCNNPSAGVIERAKKLGTKLVLFKKDQFYDSDEIANQLKAEGVEYIVLAGFLWFIPATITNAYKDRIINIHPSLLPKYGGKGMYGMNVHNAVISNKEKESGITIHLVNEVYDDGRHLFQARCIIEEGDTPQDLAARIHKLEYEFFPKVILEYISN